MSVLFRNLNLGFTKCQRMLLACRIQLSMFSSCCSHCIPLGHLCPTKGSWLRHAVVYVNSKLKAEGHIYSTTVYFSTQ